MNLFDILYQAAFALDEATEAELRQAQAELDRLLNEPKTQEEMDALCRVRGILHAETQLHNA